MSENLSATERKGHEIKNQIVCDPLDTTTRLIYADWLDDYADEIGMVGGHERAEFIRLQIALDEFVVVLKNNQTGVSEQLMRKRDVIEINGKGREAVTRERELLGKVVDKQWHDHYICRNWHAWCDGIVAVYCTNLYGINPTRRDRERGSGKAGEVHFVNGFVEYCKCSWRYWFRSAFGGSIRAVENNLGGPSLLLPYGVQAVGRCPLRSIELTGRSPLLVGTDVVVGTDESGLGGRASWFFCPELLVLNSSNHYYLPAYLKPYFQGGQCAPDYACDAARAGNLHTGVGTWIDYQTEEDALQAFYKASLDWAISVRNRTDCLTAAQTQVLRDVLPPSQ